MFNPDNFKQSDLDIFTQEGQAGVFTSVNAICVHKSKRKTLPKGLRENPIEVASTKEDKVASTEVDDGEVAEAKEEL